MRTQTFPAVRTELLMHMHGRVFLSSLSDRIQGGPLKRRHGPWQSWVPSRLCSGVPCFPHVVCVGLQDGPMLQG